MASRCIKFYKDVSILEMKKAIKWCQKELNLRDWGISFEIGEENPEWSTRKEMTGMACCRAWRNEFFACIWVNPNRQKECNTYPVSSICHEMIHILFFAYKMHNHDEQIVSTLATSLFKNWVNQQKRNKRKKND